MRNRRLVAAGVGGLLLVVTVYAWSNRSGTPPTAAKAKAAAATPSPAGAGGAKTALVSNTPAVEARVPPIADPAILARQAYHEGEFEAAFNRYREAAERNPNDAESASNCGQALVRLGKPADAIPYFERAIRLNDGRWAYHFNLAHACSELKQWDRAVQEYERAAALFPDDFVTEYNLGMTLHRQGNETAAMDHFRRAIQLQPNEADFHLALGISAERAGQNPEAVTAYRRYLELAPTAANASAVHGRVEALRKGTAR